MDDLELIKQKINIVDLISEYIPLKRAGINFKTNCPFHNEKTPSFIVSPERQIFKCFGCNRGGDIFRFLIEKEGLDFKDVLEILAKKAGIVLKRKHEVTDSRDRLFEINLKAQEFFHYILTKHLLGKKAKVYLKGRGLTEEAIVEFGIGYAPNSWDSLTKFLLKKGFTTAEIITSGLGVASKSCYDRFRGRITFPLIDVRDRIIGFSGRVLYKAEPKYLNTPQTPIFDKGSFLFALNLAKTHIRNKKEVILVEGEMDVILSHQAGFKNVIASKGTGLTQHQIELLKKYTATISLCFDTDLAGDNAARRGIEMADQAGLNIKVIVVKDGKDPADVIKVNPKNWEQAILEATPIYDYYLQSAAARFDPKNPADIRQISQELIPIWAKITDDLIREHYIQKLANLLQIEEVGLRAAIAKQQTGFSQNYSQIVHQKDEVVALRSRRQLLEEYIIALLLHIPKDHSYFPNFPETLLLSEKLRQIYVLLVVYLDSISFKGKSFDINEFIKDLPEDLSTEVDRLYLVEIDDQLAEKDSWQKELIGVVAELKKALVKASLEKLSWDIKSAQEFGKIEVVEVLNKRFRDLSVKLKNL